jgi:hypothetical protein
MRAVRGIFMKAIKQDELYTTTESHTSSRVGVEGLDDFFAGKTEANKGLSIKQAVYLYGITPKELKRRIKDGSVKAVRIDSPDGKKWRVFPDGLPEELQVFNEVVEPEVQQVGFPVDNETQAISVRNYALAIEQLNTMFTKVTQLEYKLESGVYRQSCLERQNDELRGQVKELENRLLSNLRELQTSLDETKNNRSWWRTFFGLK